MTGSAALFATVGTLAAAGFAFGAYKAAVQSVAETRRQADTAEAAFVAADRPWVEVTSLSVERISISPSGIDVGLTIGTKNIGRSPARRAFWAVEAMLDTGMQDRAERTAALCGQAAELTEHFGIEGVVFPDATKAFRTRAFASADDIERQFDGIQRREVGRAAEDKRASLAVVGCVAYAFPAGRVLGQTAFAYTVKPNCAEDWPYRPCVFDLAEDADFAGGDIVAKAADFVGFAR